MSKKNKTQQYKQPDVNEQVTEENIEDVITNETVVNDEPQEEVVEEIQEATPVENNEPIVEEVKSEPEMVVISDTDKYYISFGYIHDYKLPIYKERLKKVGITQVLCSDEEFLVGPFDTQEECIKVRRDIMSKGLKGKIVKR